MSAVGSAAAGSSAHGLLVNCAGMRGVSSSDAVSLPDIHLGTTCAHGSGSCIGVVGGWSPSGRVGNTVDELEISGTLGITVSSSVFGASLVGRESGHTTVSVHLYKVEGAVETARQLRDINVEGEFLIVAVEHLIVRLTARSHQVNTGADVLLLAIRDELESKGVTGGGDTISCSVVSAIESTVSCASGTTWASRSIPSVSSITIREVLSVM